MEEYDEGRGGLWRRGIEDEGIVMDDAGGGGVLWKRMMGEEEGDCGKGCWRRRGIVEEEHCGGGGLWRRRL